MNHLPAVWKDTRPAGPEGKENAPVTNVVCGDSRSPVFCDQGVINRGMRESPVGFESGQEDDS
jgi:hypothetical protein